MNNDDGEDDDHDNMKDITDTIYNSGDHGDCGSKCK